MKSDLREALNKAYKAAAQMKRDPQVAALEKLAIDARLPDVLSEFLSVAVKRAVQAGVPPNKLIAFVRGLVALVLRVNPPPRRGSTLGAFRVHVHTRVAKTDINDYLKPNKRYPDRLRLRKPKT